MVFIEGLADPLQLRKPLRYPLLKMCPGRVHREAISPCLLGLVRGDIGTRQQFRFTVAVEQRDAYTGRRMDDLVTEDGCLPSQGLDDPVGNELSLVSIGLREDHGELVPTDSCEYVRLAHATPQRHRDCFEQIVSCLVSKPIVDLLEVVEIDQEHCAGGTVARRPADLFGQFLLEAPPIEQTREKIVVDQIFKASHLRLAFGDVLNL